jgi:hypothetical protein
MSFITRHHTSRLCWKIWTLVRVWYSIANTCTYMQIATFPLQLSFSILLFSVNAYSIDARFSSMIIGHSIVAFTSLQLEWRTYIPTCAELGEWTVWNSLSYTLLSGVSSREQAEEECNKLGSKLASLTTAAQSSYVATLQRSFTSWIGYTRGYMLTSILSYIWVWLTDWLKHQFTFFNGIGCDVTSFLIDLWRMEVFQRAPTTGQTHQHSHILPGSQVLK